MITMQPAETGEPEKCDFCNRKFDEVFAFSNLKDEDMEAVLHILDNIEEECQAWMPYVCQQCIDFVLDEDDFAWPDAILRELLEAYKVHGYLPSGKEALSND